MVIREYPVSTGVFSLDIPSGAVYLAIDNPAGGAPVMWWLLDPAQLPVTRQFQTVPNETPVPTGKYLGSAFVVGGSAIAEHLYYLSP